jgi:hypothetical protein
MEHYRVIGDYGRIMAHHDIKDVGDTPAALMSACIALSTRYVLLP